MNNSGPIGPFMKSYARTARRHGLDANDRHYSRRLEAEIKRMPPLEFDRVLRDLDDGDQDDGDQDDDSAARF